MSDIDTSPPVSDSTQTTSPRLSPGVSYYLRRLLRQNLDRLLMADAGAIGPSMLNNLESLVEGAGGQSLNVALRELEDLAQQHQTLSNQGLKSRQSLRHTEDTIFRYLGLSLKEENQQATVLIVDDTPDNLRLLSTALSQHGYTVRSAINGALALSSAQVIKPDLILLDIMMPGLNGYEVCERLKSDPKTSDIPVIFISAIDDALDKVKAFSVGGVDYITKPFQIEEVLVRIEHQLKIWNLQKRLEEQSIRFQQEILERQQTDAGSRQLFENAVNGVYQIAPDGKFLSVNDELVKLYGYESAEELIASTTAQQLYANPRQYNEFVNQLQVDGLITGLESEVYLKNKEKLWISETARAVRDKLDNLLYYEGTVTNISNRKEAEDGWRRGRQRTTRLLLALFPKAIAQQYGKSQETVFAEQFPSVTILYANVIGIQPLAAELSPQDFLSLLNQIFFDFSRLAEKHNVEPVKTIGSEYMAIAGLPTPSANHAISVIRLALGMQKAMTEYQMVNTHRLKLRIGIHSGRATAGIIGQKRLSYDVWGDAVHIARCLEAEGLPGKTQVSAATYELIKSHYSLERHGTLTLRNGPTLNTYWL